MSRSGQQLRADALTIWQAGVDAVRPERLIPQYLAVDGDQLLVGNEKLPLGDVRRIVVVGGGKAGAGMVRAVEAALGPQILREKQVTGLVNVPADCVGKTQAIELVAARPAGANEPTVEGVQATRRILQLVGNLAADDLCLCLISGGGSALLAAPIDGFDLTDLVALTRDLSASGATIGKMNAVRRELSSIKGGGLARACHAGRLVTLILSDVLGDDLATIASGPTVDVESRPQRAIENLRQFNLHDTPSGERAIRLLQARAAASTDRPSIRCTVTNLVIGNNAAVVDAAGIEAEHRGYSHAMDAATAPESSAEEVAARLAKMAARMRDEPGPDCLISGGEPTVQLTSVADRGLGGRNQQLALSALGELHDWRGVALLSGGTDGEDGPTDAAGAIVDEALVLRARELRLDAADYLRRNDAYHFFEQTGGLIKTGPTNTNVCDVRVITVGR